MTSMYRAYNGSRQCCNYRSMQTENFNDTVTNCAANNHVRNTRTNDTNNTPIGMAYVPIQEWSETYDSCEALYEGSAFPELNLIFCGVRGN